jgi:hypothetical protein
MYSLHTHTHHCTSSQQIWYLIEVIVKFKSRMPFWQYVLKRYKLPIWTKTTKNLVEAMDMSMTWQFI